MLIVWIFTACFIVGGFFGAIHGIREGREEARQRKEWKTARERERDSIRYYQYKLEKLEKQEK